MTESVLPSQSLIEISASEAPWLGGIDIGGTATKLGVVDSRGKTLAYAKFPTDHEKGPRDAVQRIAERLAQLLDPLDLAVEDLAAVGLGTSGTHDLPAGMILDPPNMPSWRNTPIRDMVQEALGRPVAYLNDATAAAYGEYWIGAGSRFESMVLFTFGTGVGGGVILGDQSLDGAHSHASELGHFMIDCREDARPCSCGDRGHLESYASATSLVLRAEETIAAGSQTSLREVVDRGEKLNGLTIATHAEQGDELSLELVMQTANYVALACVSVMHIIDPQAIIFGGAMNFGRHESPLGRRYLARIREEIRRRAFPVPAQNTIIDFASLGADAGYLGAAGAARKMVNP